MSVHEMAREFDAATLHLLADAAEHKASLLRVFEPKPWRRSKEQNEAVDTFTQFAAYARRILEMGRV